MLVIIWGFVNILFILGLSYLFRLGIVNDRKRVKKQLSYYKLLLNWNLCDTENEKLGAYILGCGYKEVMIYGAGDLGKILYHKINTTVNICALLCLPFLILIRFSKNYQIRTARQQLFH